MPQCMQCHEFLPPDLCEIVQPGDLHLCRFCKEGTGVITINMVLMNKAEVIYDYKELLGRLKDASNLSEKIRDVTVEGAVKKLRKQ